MRPVIICGAGGGGTSYVTKLLRYTGFFAGMDSGWIGDRKFHESRCFKEINYALGIRAGDRNLLSPESIAAVEHELNARAAEWERLVRDELESLQNRFGTPRRHLLLRMAMPLIRLSNRLVPGVRWTWPGYVMCRVPCFVRGQPWGWKDPRNSITLPLWRRVFPGARVLVIVKDRSAAPPKSPSGNWFNTKASDALLERYQSPRHECRRGDIRTVRFEAVTTDHRAFNELLRWIGLPAVSRRQFRGLLAVSGYELPVAGSDTWEGKSRSPLRAASHWPEISDQA